MIRGSVWHSTGVLPASPISGLHAQRPDVRRQELDPDSFSIVTEFAVALAGFSGIAIALSHNRGALAPMDRFRTLNLLMWALGAAFVSTFPLIASAFGAQGSSIWWWSSTGFLPVLVIGVAAPLKLVRALPANDRAALSKTMWVLAVGGNASVILAQLSNVLPLFGPAVPGPLLAGLIWLLFLAALLFVRLLVNRPGNPAT